MFWSEAWAQASGAPKGPGFMEQMIPFLLIFVVIYFFILRPQQARIKKHGEFLNQLKKGAAVLTSGGILGTVEGITEKFVTLAIADGVRIRILKTSILGEAQEGEKK